MMAVAEKTTLGQARDLTRLAAQWLQLLSFAAHDGAPVYSPSVCYYHAMLDPGASDTERLTACRAMERSVRRRLLAEDLAAESNRAGHRPVDPYKLHWHTTRDGAALWMIVHLLSVAIRGFENEGVTT